MESTQKLYHVVVCKTIRILIGSQFGHLVRRNPKKVTHYFYASWSSIVSFYVLTLMPYYPVLFLDEKCLLFITCYRIGNVSEETKSRDSRDILRVWFCFKISHSVSCNTQDNLYHALQNHFLRLLFKPHSYLVNKTKTRSNKQRVLNQSKSMKN